MSQNIFKHVLYFSCIYWHQGNPKQMCVCFQGWFLETRREERRGEPLFPILVLLFSCTSNILCVWFCLNSRMASNHILWKLPTSSHPCLWFVFFLLLIFGNLQRQTDMKLGGLHRAFYSSSVCVKHCGPTKAPLVHLLFQTQPSHGLMLHS